MSKKIALWISLFGVLSLLSVSSLWAQRAKGPWGGWGPGGRYAGMYDPQAVETVSAEVVKVERFTGGKGMSYGVRLLVKTDRETIPVMLGPGWYLEKQAVKIQEKDRVEITGSRGRAWGQTVLIAGEVKKSGQVLRLRDADGVPLWAGKRWKTGWQKPPKRDR